MDKIRVLIIDGQGGGLGRQLIGSLKAEDSVEIIAVGTNSSATEAMRRAGAQMSATGENAVIVACRSADIILGAVGIIMADSLLGEITSAMALAVARSRAEKILIPMNRCGIIIAGCSTRTTAQCVEDAAEQVRALARSRDGSQK